MIMRSLWLICSILFKCIYGSHFRGGAITWRPEPKIISTINSLRTIVIEQRYAWSKTALASACTSATILSYGTIGENIISALQCYSFVATCTAAQYNINISTLVPCTDYNTIIGMSYGYSSTSIQLKVLSSGIVLGYVVGGAWLRLQLAGGGWSMMTYINMRPRSDNQLINSSPQSDLPLVNYIPAGSTRTTLLHIPMTDTDGDDMECRFSLISNTLGGVVVDECDGVCNTMALPVSTVLTTINNTCTLTVSLPNVGYYSVALQLEDFIPGTTTVLSSVPLHFLLLAYDATNPASSCTIRPVVTSIPPDLPSQGDTVVVHVNLLYTAMVIANAGCIGDPDTSISHFITSSPPGMLKTNLPYVYSSTSFAINLTWTPIIDQFNQTYTFCVVAVDINYRSSDQYCFYFYVGPIITTTTTTTTTSSTSSSTSTSTSTTDTTSTSSSSTTTTSETTTTTTTTESVVANTKECNCVPIIVGLSLGLGIPLLFLFGLLSSLYLFQCCSNLLSSAKKRRIASQNERNCARCRQSNVIGVSKDEKMSKTPQGTVQYREQYINNNNGDESVDELTTSPVEPMFQSSNEKFRDASLSAVQFRTSSAELIFGSNSTTSLIPIEKVSSDPLNSYTTFHPKQNRNSLLVQAYSKQAGTK